MNNQQNTPGVSFNQFIEKFPEVKLPVILAEDTHHSFSKHNEPLPGLMIEQYLQPLEVEPVDEYTEFVPCLRIPETYDFHAVIYWKAGLMNYQYALATFTTEGVLIDKKIIAGTFTDGKVLTTSVATLDDDWVIYIASGQSKEGQFEASNSTASQLELLPEGNIIKIDK